VIANRRRAERDRGRRFPAQRAGRRTTPSPAPRWLRRTATVAAILIAAGAAGAASAAEFEFARLNRTYSQFVDQLEPVVLGPVEVLLRSPRHQLQLSRHHAWLEPATDGTHKIRLEIEISGSGTIDAVLKAAGLEGKLEDELVLPHQTLRLDGRIRLARSPAGYQIALVEAPESVQVQIQSQLAGRLVPVCRQMALVLVNFDCAALEQALSLIQVPLPAPGTEFLLPIEEITPAEAKVLDGYLVEAARKSGG
jgi:hypothetical protein